MMQGFWRWLCYPSTLFDDDKKAIIDHKNLLTTLSDISIEAKYRQSVGQEDTLKSEEPRILQTIRLLCQHYNNWTPESLDRHFRSARWNIWLYAVKTPAGCISRNPATKFGKHYSVRVVLGSEEMFMKRLEEEQVPPSERSRRIQDAGFDDEE